VLVDGVVSDSDAGPGVLDEEISVCVPHLAVLHLFGLVRGGCVICIVVVEQDIELFVKVGCRGVSVQLLIDVGAR
jgi:hypothetical protein